MGIGCCITIVATFIQTFAPYHNLGVFIFGRVLIGLGQGIALSKPCFVALLIAGGILIQWPSCWARLYRRDDPS